MDETRNDPIAHDDILLSFVNWLEEEAEVGYNNTVWDGGISALLDGYRGTIPEAAVTALANYNMLTISEREVAIERATSIVLAHLTHYSATKDVINEPEIIDLIGLHPDYVSWAGNGTGYKATSANPDISASSHSREIGSARLRAMPYQDYLRTDHWQQIRRAALSRARHRCQLCNSPNKLQVHHRTYERRGNERDDDVIVLCDSCHSRFHKAHPGFARRTRGNYRRATSGAHRARGMKRPANGDPWFKKWIFSLAVFGMFVLVLAGYTRTKDLGNSDATEAAKSTTTGVIMATYDTAANGTATAFQTVPSPVATPTAIPTPSAAPTQRYQQSDLMYQSWVAFSPEIRIRFFAPPSITETPDSHARDSYYLRSPSTYVGGGYEVLGIYRFRDRGGGDAPGTWKVQNDAFLSSIGAKDYSVTLGPSPQQIGPFLGQRGQFNYAQASNGIRISGTMWVGQVDSDIVVIVYRCEPNREYWLDREMTQIMDTIDFNAT